MKILKKIIPLFCCITIVFSSVCPPAAALSPALIAKGAHNFIPFAHQLYTYWKEAHPDSPDSEYTGFNPGGAYGGGAGRTDEDISAAYDTYVSNVQSTLGTSTVGNNCIYLGNWSMNTSKSDSELQAGTFASGSTFNFKYTFSGSSTLGLYVDASFVAPVSGSYVFTAYETLSRGNSFSMSSCCGCYLYDGSTNLLSHSGLVNSVSFSLTAGVTYTFEYYVKLVSADSSFSPNYFGAVRMEYPTGGLASAAGTTDISTETRTGSLCGDFFYEGDGGTMTTAENVYFFDETTNNYVNPQTGSTTAISRWTYDYTTRTYNLYDANGNLISVAYQDSGVVVQEGDTTYNYYYAGSDSGGGGSGGGSSSSGSSSSGGESGGTTIGGMIEGLLSTIGDAFKGLIKGILSLLTKAVEALSGIGGLFKSLGEKVLGLFGGFTDFLVAVFPFLPEEFFQIFTFGFILLIAAAVIRRLLR